MGQLNQPCPQPQTSNEWIWSNMVHPKISEAGWRFYDCSRKTLEINRINICSVKLNGSQRIFYSHNLIEMNVNDAAKRKEKENQGSTFYWFLRILNIENW